MSFRFRLFLIATLIVTLVLAAVLMLGWSRILAFEVDRLDARLCLEAKRLAMEPAPDGLRELEVDLVGKLHLETTDQLMLRIEPLGHKVLQSANWREGLVIDAPGWVPARRQDGPARLEGRRGEVVPRDADGMCEQGSFAGPRGPWRAARYSLPQGHGFVAVDLAATKGELQAALRAAVWLVIPLAVLLSALGAWLLASLSMRPLDRLREAMKRVSGHALDQRLSRAGEDREFRELIDAYNTMLDRLEASFRQASRFSADAAHELRTPLTILQGRIEQALCIRDGERQLDLTRVLDEVGRLSGIVRKLLLLSQADAGQLALQREAVDLSAMLDEMLADALMLLDGQHLASQLEPGLCVKGDAVLLRQLLNNLLSNALRHGSPAGEVRIVAKLASNGVELYFCNPCVPIPEREREHFFDRFHRGRQAHEQGIEGSGLGLSLAREIARAHGGELRLAPGPADEVRLCLWLPS